MAKGIQERRNNKRYIVRGLRTRLREKYFLGLLSKPTSQEYPCLDISETGMQFATKKRFSASSRILLDISIPTTRSNPIRVKARVVWVNLSDDLSFGRVGVKFVQISKPHYNSLKLLIEKTGNDKSHITPYLQAKLTKEDTLFMAM
jgi:hypothetical protein